MFKKILFPTDGSETSVHALDYIIDMAKQFNSEVVLVNAYKLPLELSKVWVDGQNTGYLNNMEDDFTCYGNTIMEELEDKLKENKIKVKRVLKKGPPEKIIVETALDENCDVIVMSRRGLSAIREILLGSVSHYVVHHAKCPVLLVK